MFLLFFHPLASLAIIDWSDYPTCAQPQLQDTAPIDCDYGDEGGGAVESNSCLCTDDNFLNAAALAIYNNCGCTDLVKSANAFISNCDETDTPAVLNTEEFVAAGDGGLPTCSSGGTKSSSASDLSPTASAGGQPSSTGSGSQDGGNESGGGTPESNKIALGVGIGVGLPGAIAGLIGIYRCIERRD